MIAPSIFESFNARSLNPTQVADRFVPSEQYKKLIKRNHTIVVGPRGSGKTTLLKMLQQPALESWKHPDAEDYRNAIDFTGVFIPTDVTWAEQIFALGDGCLDTTHHQLLGVAAFTTHTLRALVLAMINRIGPPKQNNIRPFRRVVLEKNAQSELVREISASWEIKPTIITLEAVRQALTNRLSDIQIIASQEQSLSKETRGERLAKINYLHLHFLSAASVAVEKFSDLTNTTGEKWALLFDELELAPDSIRQRLLTYLRSTDDKFLFKLALSPSNPDFKINGNPLSASGENDFEQIPLWYAEKNDGYEFCNDLWHSILKERRMPTVEPIAILGRSNFEAPAEEYSVKKTAYRSDSHWGIIFKDLMKRDKSFAHYLMRKNIDVDHLDRISGDQRAADLRKAAPIIALRLFYRSVHQPNKIKGQKIRSRKTASIYGGANSVFAITEGNPRWFIGLINKLLDHHFNKSINKMVSHELQATEMQKVSSRFQSMIKTIPISKASANISYKGVLEILQTVAEYFYEQAVVEDFSPDPPATFRVDSHLDQNIIISIEKALNAGAIVYVPDQNEDIFLTSIKGRRFRLSYLFAPSFGIPLRLGPSVSLASILKKNDLKINDMNQINLIQE